jgi:hypothetical protein
MIFFLCSFIAKKKVFLTKSTKYAGVVIAEWGEGRGEKEVKQSPVS